LSAAGTLGMVDLPLYYDYYSIGFEYQDGGATPQDIIYSATGSGAGGVGGLIGDIALRINANTKRLHSARELDRLNSVNGSQFTREQIGAAANMVQTLCMFFYEPWRIDKNDRLVTVATLTPTFGVTSAQLQITLGSAMPATGSLRVFAWVDVPTTTVPKQGPLVKLVTRQDLVTNGTSLDVTTLDQSGFYQTMLMQNPTGAGSGYIGKATLKVNGTIFRELDREGNIASLDYAGMNPSTSTSVGVAAPNAPFGFDLILDDDDPINSALPAGGQNFILHLDFYSAPGVALAASGSVRTLIERLQFGW